MVYTPPSIESVPNWLMMDIFRAIWAVNEEVFNFDLGEGNVEGKKARIDLNILRYDSGDHFDIHMDLSDGDTSSLRKISVTVLLNDSYEGGKLAFDILPELSENYPEIGDMIIFPSYLEHKVEPITSGVRWSLVGWILGDKHFI